MRLVCMLGLPRVTASWRRSKVTLMLLLSKCVARYEEAAIKLIVGD